MSKANPDQTTDPDSPKEPDSENRTSQSLIVGVKENDPNAWETLVELYSPLVYFWCQESGLPAIDLNDIFQEVFHALARNIKKFRPLENGSFRGWLRTLTRNKVNDHFRRAQREPQPLGGTEALNHLQQFPAAENRQSTLSLNEGLNPLGELNPFTDSKSTDPSNLAKSPTRELELERSLLRHALSNIQTHFTEQTWRAFWMVVIDGRETSDVAADLEMRPGTVRVAKSRVLKRLRLEVGDSIG